MEGHKCRIYNYAGVSQKLIISFQRSSGSDQNHHYMPNAAQQPGYGVVNPGHYAYPSSKSSYTVASDDRRGYVSRQAGPVVIHTPSETSGSSYQVKKVSSSMPQATYVRYDNGRRIIYQ